MHALDYSLDKLSVLSECAVHVEDGMLQLEDPVSSLIDNDHEPILGSRILGR